MLKDSIWGVFATDLLLLAGLSVAQNPNPKAWGKEVNGFQMSIYLDQAEGGRVRLPKFRVELRNTGQKDLLLNLGIMTRDGGKQYPTAVSLILAGAQGEFQQLTIKKSLASDDGKEALFLPLPVGSTFSFPVDLGNYAAAAASTESDNKLKPGIYWIAAHLTGFIGTDANSPYPTKGQPTAGRPFDIVNPEAGLGRPPMSNTLRFEVPIQ